MTLHRNSFQAEQNRPVVTTMIETTLEVIEHRNGNQGSDLGQPVALELLAQGRCQHLGQSFGSLQSDITDKAVTNNDIGLAFVDAIAFDVADKIEARGAQQVCCRLDDFVALDFLFADIQDTDAGYFSPLVG